MLKRNRYQLMTAGVTLDGNKDAFPDPLTLPLTEFEFTSPMKKHVLTQVEIDRFDLFLYGEYQNCYYGDIVLFLNKRGSVHEFAPGDTIELPSRIDLEKFYIKYRVS